MIRAVDSEKCCGCGACASVRHQNCISFAADGECFLYPSVDEKNCVGCNMAVSEKRCTDSWRSLFPSD